MPATALNSPNLTLLMAADDNFAMPLAVAAFSALTNLPSSCKADIYVIDGGMTDQSRDRVKRAITDAHELAQVHFCEVDLSVLSHCNVGRYTITSLARIFVAQVVPENVERVLYLDSDVVVTGDLSELWELNLKNDPIMVVKEKDYPNKKTVFRRNFEEIQIDRDAGYFNAGVILFQMQLWRAQKHEQRTIATLMQHGATFALPDQDALNVALYGQWGQLDLRWNLQVYDLKSYTDYTNGIVHYSVKKPWGADYHLRAGEQFIAAYLRSGWDPKHKAIPKAALMFTRNGLARFWRRLKRGTRRIWRLTGGRLIKVKPSA